MSLIGAAATVLGLANAQFVAPPPGGNDPTVASWASEAVSRLRAMKVVWGDGRERFNGSSPANRRDTVFMISRLLGSNELKSARKTGRDAALFAAITPAHWESPIGPKPVEMFKDIDAQHYWAAQFDRASQAGVIRGFPDVYFRMKRPLKRGELAMICARLLLLSKREAQLIRAGRTLGNWPEMNGTTARSWSLAAPAS
jgi:hypothetical protein